MKWKKWIILYITTNFIIIISLFCWSFMALMKILSEGYLILCFLLFWFIFTILIPIAFIWFWYKKAINKHSNIDIIKTISQINKKSTHPWIDLGFWFVLKLAKTMWIYAVIATTIMLWITFWKLLPNYKEWENYIFGNIILVLLIPTAIFLWKDIFTLPEKINQKWNKFYSLYFEISKLIKIIDKNNIISTAEINMKINEMLNQLPCKMRNRIREKISRLAFSNIYSELSTSLNNYLVLFEKINNYFLISVNPVIDFTFIQFLVLNIEYVID